MTKRCVISADLNLRVLAQSLAELFRLMRNCGYAHLPTFLSRMLLLLVSVCIYLSLRV